MKKTILTLVAGLLIGGGTLGPLAATAQEAATLRQRVSVLEQRLDAACNTAKLYRPAYHQYLEWADAC